MTRREKARIVAERVAVRLAQVTPEGLSRWGPTWGLVDVPSDVYMDALSLWEESDTPTTRSELEAASTALIGAWSSAAQKWEAAGRPTHDEPEVIKV